MKQIESQLLERLPVTGLSRVRDLIYFDGPLLTEYVNSHGEHFLYYWCDKNQSHHRWMLIRVEERTVLRLLHRFVPLDLVIPHGGQDDFVYFVDVASGGSVSGVWLTPTRDVPDEYQPAPQTFLQDIPRRTDAGYPVLIEGEWDASDLMGFPRLFELTYSFLYVANRLVDDRCFGGYSWRGGWPAAHFNRLIASIPTESRLSVEAIQYSSPGFMRFSVDYDIAELVAMSIEDVQSAAVNEALKDLKKYIRRNGLNDINDPDDGQWLDHNPELLRLTRAICNGLRAVDGENVIRGSQRAFEAAQIVRWFCRRMDEIGEYQRNGLVRFAPVDC